MNKLLILTVMMSFVMPAFAADTYCSTMSVTMANEDGTPIEGPSNTLSSPTCGLNHEQLIKHHYLLTGLMGAAVVAASKAALDGDAGDDIDVVLRSLAD